MGNKLYGRSRKNILVSIYRYQLYFILNVSKTLVFENKVKGPILLKIIDSIGKNGEMNLSSTYEKIYGDILPSLDFEVDNDFNFELYDERFSHDSEESEFDIYVPVK